MPICPPVVLCMCVVSTFAGALLHSSLLLLVGAEAFVLAFLLDLFCVDMTQDRTSLFYGFALTVSTVVASVWGLLLPFIVLLALVALIVNCYGVANGMRRDHPHVS
jgi:ABC-type uncharacterized transport system permease subunit